jgi:hypothetical protein
MPLMILVAGPYRSGTNDDPHLIEQNVVAMTDVSLQLFRAGHLPVMGEWFALPLIAHAGSNAIGGTARRCTSRSMRSGLRSELDATFAALNVHFGRAPALSLANKGRPAHWDQAPCLSASEVKLSAKKASSGRPHFATKSRCAASTITGAPQA